MDLTTKEGKNVSRIPVRTLVEFLMRSGDLDSRTDRGPDMEAALKGGRIHRKLQKSQDGFYHSEVMFQRDSEFDDLVIRVEGRADGVMGDLNNPPEEGITIDEIKGMYLDVSTLKAPFPVHLAQAKCYAAMAAAEYSLPLVRVRMTYANLDTEELNFFYETYEAEEIEKWYLELVGEWYRWAKWEMDHIRDRNKSMERLEFPFPYREGQQKLTAAVYHTIVEGKELFLMAPTGVGKTMSCVFPAVRAVGEGYGDKIFYLTARNETMKAGSEAFAILSEKGLDYRTIRITAKEKICPLREPSCNPDDCPYAKGHFDRINDTVFELLQCREMIDAERIRKAAGEHRVCPFELTLDTASWCDAVLCDYNYVFDPNASLKRFFANGAKGEYIFLIDEAHNLVERGREMFSAALIKEHILSARRLIGDGHKKLEKAFSRVNRFLLAMKRECEAEPKAVFLGHPYRPAAFSGLDKLLTAVYALIEELNVFFEESGDGELKQNLLDVYFELRDFLAAAESFDENYQAYEEIGDENEFFLKLFCMNPAARITEQIDKGRSAVFFSATLLPVDYYKRLLTTREDPYAIYAPSPFDTGKRLLLVAGDVSTRFASRGIETYRRIAQYILDTARSKTGNYLVFFPSHRMMRDVYEVFKVEFDSPDVNYVMQSSMMLEDDREIFLENFYEDPERSLVGFCVMGGSFSEGLDLAGTRLIGAVIVGAGIPQLSNEREILKEYYDGLDAGSGFDYAYRFPGINKVQQAAGRVIRTETDTGVILLLDDRLLTRSYQRLFPLEWSNYERCTAGSLPEQLEKFWNSW